MNKRISLLLALMLVLVLAFCLTACDNPFGGKEDDSGDSKVIVSFEISGPNIVDYTSFSINNYKIVVTYKDGSTAEAPLKMDYFEASELEAAISDGQPHTINVTYGGIVRPWVIKIIGVVNFYKITWKNYDDTILEVDSAVREDTTPSYSGATPTKAPVGNYIYEFTGWTPSITKAVQDTTYKATFKEVFNSYTVIFRDYDGKQLLKKEKVKAKDLSSVLIEMDDPFRQATDSAIYEFVKWEESNEDDLTTKIYTAVYKEVVKQYTINFVDYNGNILQSSKEDYGTIPTFKKDDPTRVKEGITYFEFSGWAPNIAQVTGDTEYVAQYSTKTKIEINFDLSGGMSYHHTVDTIVLENDTDITKDYFVFDLEKTGYNFNGWRLNGQKVFDDKGNKIRDFKLYASMTFSAIFIKGGYLTILSNYIDAGVIYGEGEYSEELGNPDASLSVTDNKGYTFDGWYEEDGTTLISKNREYVYSVGNNKKTVFANFTLNPYTLTATTAHEEVGLVYINFSAVNKTVSQEVNYTESVSVTAMTIDGDVPFLGWFIDNKLVSTGMTYTFNMTNEDMNIQARWCKYNVSYELDGGTNDPSNPSVYYTGKEFTALAIPTKEHYDFVGWLCNGEYRSIIESSCQGDIVLVAQWRPTDYSITYDLNGGELDGSNPDTYTFFSGDIILENPRKESYNFIGWKLSGEGDEKAVTVCKIPQGTTGNRTYVAVYRSVPLAITYHLNGGTNGDNPQTITLEALPVYLKPATKTDESFIGWNLSSDGNARYVTSLTEYKSYNLYAIFNAGTEGLVYEAVEGGYKVTAYTGTDKNVKVPDIYIDRPVVEIGAEVFKGKDIESIVIAGSVKRILYNALSDCPNLKSITFNEGLESVGNYAVFNCPKLETVNIPSTLTSISYRMFGECTSLEEIIIPNTLTSIEKQAFQTCTALKTVVIPSSVSYIGFQAFFNCIGLTYAEINRPDNATYDSKIFDWCTSLTTIKCNKSAVEHFTSERIVYNSSSLKRIILGDGYDVIPESYFNGVSGGSNVLQEGNIRTGCLLENLTEIELSSNITKLDKHAFWNCFWVSQVVIPSSVTSIGYRAFLNCKKLTSIVIPDSVTSIGQGVFYSCEALKDVTFSKGMTEITATAFQNCSALETITVPNTIKYLRKDCFINSGLKTINFESGSADLVFDSYCFEGCSNLTEFAFPERTKKDGFGSYLFKDSGLKKITIDGNIINITDSSGSVLASCTSLEEVTIVNMTKIPASFCSGLTSLKKVNIPSTVTAIGDYAFMGSGLTTLAIPDAVTTFGNGVFKNCTSLTSATLGKGITTLSSNTFEGCTSLETYKVPNTIKYINKDVFMSSGLTTLTFEAGSQDLRFNDYCFEGCMNLTTFEFPDRTLKDYGYGNFLFKNSGIKKVVFNKNMNLYENTSSSTTIFSGSSIEEICFGGVSAIPSWFCDRLYSLKTVDLSGVDYINTWAFRYCSGLTAVDFTNVKHIDNCSFANCPNLQTVNITSSVCFIGFNAFQGCTKLTTMTFDKTDNWYGWNGKEYKAINSGLMTVENFRNEWDGCDYYSIQRYI